MKAGFLSALFLISLIAAPAIAAVPLPASVVVPDRGHDLFAAASMTRSQRNSSIPTDWGIFRRDGIGEWSLFGPRILGVAGLAYDPTNPQVLLLAAGDGVLRSEDRGRSWRQVTGWRISDVRTFAFDSGDSRRVYAATQWGGSAGPLRTDPRGGSQRSGPRSARDRERTLYLRERSRVMGAGR
jgi:hypothetical protein